MRKLTKSRHTNDRFSLRKCLILRVSDIYHDKVIRSHSFLSWTNQMSWWVAEADIQNSTMAGNIPSLYQQDSFGSSDHSCRAYQATPLSSELVFSADVKRPRQSNNHQSSAKGVDYSGPLQNKIRFTGTCRWHLRQHITQHF